MKTDEENLTFIDGLMLCKHIYQCAIDKTLNGVIEQEEIFYKAHDMLKKLENKTDIERLDELLEKFNLDNIYTLI
jgi:hypothetical protein